MQTRARSRRSKRGGFTLVELLVTLALTLFILSLFTTLFVAATGGIRTMKGIAAADQRVRNAVTILRKDLATARIRLPNFAAGQPDQAFTAGPPPQQATGGYFMIEENSPAIRQGVDQWGLPVEVDADDVLAFTVERKLNPAEILYARVPRGGFLDNFPDYRARFDEQNNGICTSQTGEVVYFLRPDGRQHTLNEVRGHDGGNPWTTTTLIQPTTYTLYRRQLVILDSNRIGPAANGTPSPGDPAMPAAERSAPDPAATSAATSFTINGVSYDARRYYNNYEIAGKPQIDPATGTPTGLVEFASMATIAERRMRFGLNHLRGNEFPFSWSSSAAPISATPQSIAVLTQAAPLLQWLGRPTSLETNAVVAPSGAIGNVFTALNSSAAPTAFGAVNADGNGNGVLDSAALTIDGVNSVDAAVASNAAIPYRYGDDVLLSNVLSFDVKVLDDDPRVEPQAGGGFPGGLPVGVAHITSTPSSGINPTRVSAADERAPEFVDLGYRGTATPGFPAETTGEVLSSGPTVDASYNSTSANEGFYGFASWNATGLGPTTRWRGVGRNGAAIAAAVGVPGARQPTYVPLRTYDTWSPPTVDDYVINPAPAGTGLFRPVPYPKPLKAIQIKLRVLEPNSGIIREVTIVHAFTSS